MRKDISYGVKVRDFDKIRVRMNAIVEAVKVEEENWLSSVILQLCNFTNT